MKTLFVLISAFLMAQSSFSQCDNPFFQIENGTTTITESFNAKGKSEGVTKMIYKDIADTDEGYRAVVVMSHVDDKKNEVHAAEYDFECVDGIVQIDFYSLIPNESMKSLETFELEVEATEIMIPSELEVGQVLPDANMKATTTNSPISMELNFSIKNRKVESLETITTPAGTFECYKITYDFVAQVMTVKNTFKGVNYIAKKVGVVKTETYKDNGKMISYSLLNEFK